MLIKKLIALCKKSGMFQVFNTEKVKYLGEGHVIYPVYQDFDFNSYTLCEIYDIDKEKIAHVNYQGLPEEVSGADTVPGELKCEVLPIQIYKDGDVFLALESVNGIGFIKKKYLAPLSDTDSDEISIYERCFQDGSNYYVAKIGLELNAIILPHRLLTAEFLGDILHFSEMCAEEAYKKTVGKESEE